MFLLLYGLIGAGVSNFTSFINLGNSLAYLPGTTAQIFPQPPIRVWSAWLAAWRYIKRLTKSQCF